MEQNPFNKAEIEPVQENLQEQISEFAFIAELKEAEDAYGEFLKDLAELSAVLEAEATAELRDKNSTQDFLEKRGVFAWLRDLADEAQTVLNKYKRTMIASNVAFYVALGVPFGPDETENSARSYQEMKITDEVIVNEKWFRGGTLSDTHERLFLSDPEKENPEFIQISTGDRSLNYNLKLMEAYARKFKSKLTITHTHPAAVYDYLGYSPEAIKDAQAGHKPVLPQGPSITDFGGALMLDYNNRYKDIDSYHQLYDPTGVWTWKIKDGTARAIMETFGEDIRRARKEVLDTMTPEERKAYISMDIEHAHPGDVAKLLSDNIKTVVLAMRLDTAYVKVATKHFEVNSDIFADFDAISDVMIKMHVEYVANNYSQPKEITQQFIKDFIQKAADVGIEVTYTPF